MTDESADYWQVRPRFAGHETVNRGASECVRGHVYSNTVEGFLSQLKRSIDGTYHHASESHLWRYLAESDYRYSNRKARDGERTEKAIRLAAGKRLQYRDSLADAGSSPVPKN